MSDTIKVVTFPNTTSSGFYSELKKRVNDYFKENHISHYANAKMVFKTGILLTICVLTYTLLISDILGPVGIFICFGTLGFMMAILGFNLSHDALHGAYTKNQSLNRFLGFVFDFCGMSSYVWKIYHNFEHHTYTNIHGMDHDIDQMIWIRCSPYDGTFWFHRYQHIYAPILYPFFIVKWIYYADYSIIIPKIKEGKLSIKEQAIFWGFKILNIITFIIVPLTFLSIPWWSTVLGIFFMYAISSVTSTIVFQLAHIVDNVQFPLPDQEGKMQDDWATHEMKTTSNFATNSKLISTLLGGLNFQIEHHLFPWICHIHYPEIQEIVKKTAKEYNIPYYEHPTLLKALKSHIRTLKKLGRGESQFVS